MPVFFIMPKKTIILAFVLLFLFAASANARSGHMHLLASTEGEDPRGSVADLYLEIRPGSGRVFIDTFPLTKLDTQISTRFAKDVACDYLDFDCSVYDFFYTIRSESIIIGGPSAGASITILTIMVLDNIKIDKKTAITGTINSGGFIGSVGGIKQKLEAANRTGITKVLIPKGVLQNEAVLTDNTSIIETQPPIDYQKIAQDYGISLIEVSTLDEVYYEFTGKPAKKKGTDITPDEEYLKTMKEIADTLCNRSRTIKNMIPDIKKLAAENNTLYLSAEDVLKRAEQASLLGAYYSEASFCFRSNILFRQLLFQIQNLSKQELIGWFEEINEENKKMHKEVSSFNIATLTDLQTQLIVHDRLIESADLLESAAKSINSNQTRDASNFLAYALERQFSAVAWSMFFGKGKKELSLDEASLRESCIRKISEAEERYQFAKLYFPLGLESTQQLLDLARNSQRNARYELCLFDASKAKAEADTFLGMISISKSRYDEYLDVKLGLAEEAIAKEQEYGNFPILGFSYYEYSKSLRDTDMYSAQLFSGYALELSNLRMYFKKEKSRAPFYMSAKFQLFLLLAMGSLVGSSVTALFMWTRFHSKSNGSIKIKIRKKH